MQRQIASRTGRIPAVFTYIRKSLVSFRALYPATKVCYEEKNEFTLEVNNALVN